MSGKKLSDIGLSAVALEWLGMPGETQVNAALWGDATFQEKYGELDSPDQLLLTDAMFPRHPGTPGPKRHATRPAAAMA